MNTKELRQKILDLAIHGKLVPQNPNDEPASVLLDRIRAEKERLIKEGKIKKPKKAKAVCDKPHYPYQLPKGWVWTTLGEITNYGVSTNVHVEDIANNSWVLELEDIEKDTASIVQYLAKNERKINGTRHKFEKGEILYSKLRTYLNKVLVAPNDGFCTTEIMAFKSFGNLSNKYICHVLRSNYFLDYTLQCGYGVKMPRVSTADACTGLIPLPPLAEQERIVIEIQRLFSIIDIVEDEKDDLQIAIQRAKTKILDLAIHGKLVSQDPNDEPAAELLKRIKPKAKIACDTPHYGKLPNGWCFIEGKDLYKPMKSAKPKGLVFNYIDIDSIDNAKQRIDSIKVAKTENAPNRASRYTQKGDIVFSMVRPYLKNIAIVPDNDCIASTGFYVCSPSNIAVAKYCYYLMISDYIVSGLNQYMKGGTDNSPSINKGDIDSWLFPIPPIAEQYRIVAKIEELFAQLDKIEASL